MKVYFYIGHPAQFHFYKNVIRKLKEFGNEVKIFIKTKDILEPLLQDTGWAYKNIVQNKRGRSKAAILLSLLRRDFIIAVEILRNRPDILISSDTSFSHNGFLFRIPCLNFMDDDYDAVIYYSKITYPFTTTVLAPDVVKLGRWEYKKIAFKGYLKLGYLHPNWFNPDKNRIGDLADKDYFLIRLSAHGAHHDSNQKGVSQNLLSRITEILTGKGQVIISSEGELDHRFEKYRLNVNIHDVHHLLYYAKAFISDSQSMSGEAAVLGTPSIRISSFKDKLSVLEELEHKYGLTYGFYPDDEERIIEKVKELIEMPDLKQIFRERRQNMLDDKIDVTKFSIWFCQHYPESLKIMKENPDYQFSFK